MQGSLVSCIQTYVHSQTGPSEPSLFLSFSLSLPPPRPPDDCCPLTTTTHQPTTHLHLFFISFSPLLRHAHHHLAAPPPRASSPRTPARSRPFHHHSLHRCFNRRQRTPALHEGTPAAARLSPRPRSMGTASRRSMNSSPAESDVG